MYAYIIYNNSVRTSKRTTHFTITKINWLTLFKEIIAVYNDNYRYETHKCILRANPELMHVEVGNTINYHGGLEGYKHSGQGKLR
jgi:hypothetical protein